MPTFRYSALNEKARSIKGELSAANDIDLEERLKEVGLELIDYRIVKQKGSSRFSKVNLKDMILLCLQLEQLDRAGVPLLDALSDARDAAQSGKMRDVLSDVFDSVKSGEVLSKAFAKYPRVFDSVFTGLIAAGEKTGQLAKSFDHLSHHMKWVNDLRRKVRKALAYPAVLAVVVSGVITTLMLTVVPKLTDFMLSQGFELPIHTKILIAFSHFMGDYWYIVLPTPVVLIMVIATLYRISEPFAYRFDLMSLKIPVIGPTIRKIDMARFTHFFAVMFSSGIDILECLSSAKKVVNNRVINASIDTVIRAVSEGNSLTNALRMSNQFPNLVVRMFKIGEDSGNLEEALENVNFFYDREVNDAVDRLVGMIQPTMTLVLGMMIAWIVASVFGPLYQTFSNLKF
ncbi:type II secretion system F family protein [bacterium]|nr:type II secretion system F family protein [bacterium]